MTRTSIFFIFFSSRRRHTSWNCDWSSDVCASDLEGPPDSSTDLVAHHVAEEGRDGQAADREAEVDVDLAGRDEQAHGEEQGVARQDREEESALDEDDDEGDHEERAPVLLEQVGRVHPLRAEGGGGGRQGGESVHASQGMPCGRARLNPRGRRTALVRGSQERLSKVSGTSRDRLDGVTSLLSAWRVGSPWRREQMRRPAAPEHSGPRPPAWTRRRRAVLLPTSRAPLAGGSDRRLARVQPSPPPPEIGVGPWEGPWPEGDQWNPELL